MKRNIILLIALLVGFSIGYAQTESRTNYPVYRELVSTKAWCEKSNYKLFSSDEQKITAEHLQYVREGKYLTLNPEALQELLANGSMLLELEIPLDGDTIALELFKSNLFSSDYLLETSDGREANHNPALYYRGTLKNDKNTIAAAGFSSSEVRILFSNETSNYRIQKTKNGNYLYFNENDLLLRQEMNCFASDIEVNHPVSDQHHEYHATDQGNCVEVYLECDHRTFLDNDEDITLTENFVAGMLNEVFTLYANENLTLIISEIFIWTTDDPYISFYDPIEMLYEFQDQKNENGYNGRLAHLLSTRNLDGGVAFRDVLCSETSPYGVSTSLTGTGNPFPAYTASVNIIAHELGHNFGSPHTHDCYWNGNDTQIDDCGNIYGSTNECYDPENPILPDDGGTIMSYCYLISGVGVNFLKGFGQQPGDLMRERYSSTTCTTGCGNNNPPPAPANVSCNKLSAMQMELHWDKVEGAFGYKIFRAQGDEDYLAISTTGPGDSTYTDTGLSPETYYCYKLKSFNDGGDSEFSAGDCDTLPQLMDVIIRADSIIACPGEIAVPVTLKNAEDVFGFHLNLNYPDSSLAFLTAQNLHPSLANGAFALQPTGDRIFMYLNAESALMISDDVLLELVFTCDSANLANPLTWDTTGTNCEFLDWNGNNLNAEYFQGTANTLAVIDSLEKPTGKDTVCVYFEEYTGYQSLPLHESAVYQWSLEPAEAGVLAQNENEVTVHWNTGIALPPTVNLSVQVSGECYSLTSSLMVSLPDSVNCGVGIRNINPARHTTEIFPNPFSGSTTIAFELQQKSTVVIHFYTSDGLLVETTQNTYPAGTNRITWNSRNLPPGLYYCVVQIGDDREIRKVIVLGE